MKIERLNCETEHGWRPRLLQHLLQLDPQSRRQRFMGPMSDAGIQAYVASCNPKELYFSQSNGVDIGVLEIHEGSDKIEAAISILKDHQGMGIGRLLLDEAKLNFQKDVSLPMHLYVAHDNGRIHKLLQSIGARCLSGSTGLWAV